MLLSEANELYVTAGLCTATREAVEHAEVRSFVRAVRQVLRAAVEYPEDELLADLGRVLKSARWNLHSIPLGFAAAEVGLRESAVAIRRLACRAAAAYGDQVGGPAKAAADVLELIALFPDNPMGTRIVEILATGNASRSAVLVRRPEHAQAIERALRLRPGNVVSQEQLADLAPLDTMVVVGPTRWYRGHVVNAPRAEQLCFVHYGWILDGEPDGGLFDGSRSAGVSRKIRVAVPPQLEEPDGVDAGEFIPEVDWSRLVRSDQSRGLAEGQDDRTGEPVKAQFYLLAGGYVAYLGADDGAKVDVVDASSGATQVLERQLVREVTVGDYVLLRSAHGGEDYLQAVANVRLGKDAPYLRALQVEWKQALRRLVARVGYHQLESQLWRKGASVVNVGYWVQPESIKTLHRGDFALLMESVGLGGKEAEIWAAMERITGAHMWAGGELRRLLEAQVLRSDLSELRRSGRMDFDLDGVDAGSLSIFRIEGCSPDPVMVPPSWLRWPRKVDAAS